MGAVRSSSEQLGAAGSSWEQFGFLGGVAIYFAIFRCLSCLSTTHAHKPNNRDFVTLKFNCHNNTIQHILGISQYLKSLGRDRLCYIRMKLN